MGRKDAVAFMLECAVEWRSMGALVTYEDGWATRGNGTSADYEGGEIHHTASNSTDANPFPTRNLLLKGRPDLPPPLCNVAGPRSKQLHLHVMAAFPANHAGASGGRSMGPLPVTRLFNPRVLGLEIDYAGSSPMTDLQYNSAAIFGAGITRVLRRGSAEWIRGHAETSITGKWDPGYASGKTIDMAAFRRKVWALATGEDSMALNDTDKAWIQDQLRAFVWEATDGDPASGDPNAMGNQLVRLGQRVGGLVGYTEDNKPTKSIQSLVLDAEDDGTKDGGKPYRIGYQVALTRRLVQGLDAKLDKVAQAATAAPTVQLDAAQVAAELASNPVFITAVKEGLTAELTQKLLDAMSKRLEA